MNHATNSKDHLFEHYTSEKIERCVEKVSQVDYDIEYMELKRVKIGEAKAYYQKSDFWRSGVQATCSKI